MNRHDFLKTLAGGTAALLVPRWVGGDEASEPKTLTYKRVGDCEIKLDVYGADPRLRKPACVYIHGGALINGSRKDAPKWLTQQQEYIVISIDYRLAPEAKLPAIIEDVQDAFRWVHKHGPRLLNIDTQKLAVAGESAGGYLTLMTGFCIKPRPKALVSISGYGDIDGTWYSRPDPFYLTKSHVAKEDAYASVGTTCVSDRPHGHGGFYLYCRQLGIWPLEVTGHNPDTDPRWFDRYCPVRNVSAEYPPTVLLHGTADTDVPHEESVAMDKQLTVFNVPHKFISVTGAGHGISGVPPADKLGYFQEALAFVKEHVG